MSDIQRQHAQNSKILLVTGGLCTLFGLFMYAQRAGFAGLFLSAQFLFGIPYSGSDAFKVLVVAIGSLITVLMGLALLAVGVVLFLKASAPLGGASPNDTATPTR